MQRAAAGLARRCALLLAGGRRVRRPGGCCCRRPATTAATRCTPGRVLARRGAAGRRGAARAGPTACRAGWPRCGARAGGSPTRRDVHLCDLVRGRHRRHRRPRAGCAAGGRACRAGRRCRDGGRSWSRSTCPAGSTRRHRRGRPARRCAPTSPSRSAPQARPAGRPGAPLAGQVELVDIGLAVLPAPRRRGAAGGRRRRAGGRGRRRRRTSTPAAWSASRTGSRPTRGRPCCRVGRRAGRAGRDGALRRAAPAPAGARRAPVGGRRHRRRRGRPGAGLGRAAAGWAPTSGRRPSCARVLGAPVPAVLDADALTLLGDGALPTGCASATPRRWSRRTTGEFARLAGADRGAARLAGCAARWPRPDSARGAAQGRPTVVAAPGRRRSGSTRPARRRWPPPAPATCWPGCSVSLLAGGLARRRPASRRRGCTAWPAGARGRTAAGPVTAPDVADGAARWRLPARPDDRPRDAGPREHSDG